MNDTIKRCPFCGCELSLDKCPIAEIEFTKDVKVNTSEEYQSVYTIKRYIKRKAFGRTIPDENALERYICYQCGMPLPQGFADLPVKMISIVGLNRGGKTFLLGTALPLAYRNGFLKNYLNGSIASFDDLEETDSMLVVYTEDMKKGKLPATQVEDKTLKPFFFRVRMSSGYQFIIVLYDFGGEIFQKGNRRAKEAPFLKWSDAVIFVADPTNMERLSALTDASPEYLKESSAGTKHDVTQVSLLNKIIDTTFSGHEDDRIRHLALVLTKGDLIYNVPGVGRIQGSDGKYYDCRSFATQTNFNDKNDLQIARINTVNFLNIAGEEKIVELTKRAPSYSFHTVSAWTPDNGFTVPIRVLDPWAVTIARLGGVNFQC